MPFAAALRLHWQTKQRGSEPSHEFQCNEHFIRLRRDSAGNKAVWASVQKAGAAAGRGHDSLRNPDRAGDLQPAGLGLSGTYQSVARGKRSAAQLFIKSALFLIIDCP